MKTGQNLSKMSKPTALNTEGTAQVSEWFNLSDTGKKLSRDKSNSGIAVVITTKLQTGTFEKLNFKVEEAKVKQTHRFKNLISVILARVK